MILAKSIESVRSPQRMGQFAPTADATASIGNASVSIVVPVLNEAGLIGPFLRHLRSRAPGAELVVADGGSTDGTRETAEALSDCLVISGRGRAQQLNEGARAAHGEVLWFLHVDSEVPTNSLDRIRAAMADAKTVGGYFRIRLPKTHVVYRLTDTLAHYAGIVLRIRCGDHGFFCRRREFFQIGGFPDVPLMEDVEFYRALRRFGSVRVVSARMKTSTRRYEQLGRVRVTLAYGLIATLFVLGVRLSTLARIYRRTCCVAGTQ